MAASQEILGVAWVIKRLKIFPTQLRDVTVRAGYGHILHSCPVMGLLCKTPAAVLPLRQMIDALPNFVDIE